MTYSYYLQLHGSSSLQKKNKMLTQRIFFAKIIPTLDTLLLLSSGNFLSFPTTITTTTPIKILQFKKKLLLLLLVVPSPELILVLKHPLYLLYASQNKLTPQNMFMIQKTVFFTA